MTHNKAPILHRYLPEGQLDVAALRLPSLRPVDGPWLCSDHMYRDQMRLRRRLLARRERDVYAQLPAHVGAARGFLGLMLDALPDRFETKGGSVICPDGEVVKLDWDAPLFSVGQIIQQDVCILERHNDEHILTGAVLCFPASWTLAQKIGKPLTRVHAPVPEYTVQIAKRVQRMFDGVQTDRPMWRANALRYDDPDLFQPRLEGDVRPVGHDTGRYMRSERQTVLRLPHAGAVAFVIHTSVVRYDLEDKQESGR